MASLVKSIEASLPRSSPASTVSGSTSPRSCSDEEPWTINLCSLIDAPVQAVSSPAAGLSTAAKSSGQESSPQRARLLAEVTEAVRRNAEAEAERKFHDAWRRCERIYEGMAKQQAQQQAQQEQQLQVMLDAQAQAEKENEMLRRTVQMLATRLNQALDSGTLQRAAQSAPGLRREPVPVCHTVLLSRSEGQSIGLDLAPSSDGCLEVVKLLPGGAAELRNRQATAPSQRIVSGDRLVSVNGVETADAMVQELRLKRRLTIKIARAGDRLCDRLCNRVQRGVV